MIMRKRLIAFVMVGAVFASCGPKRMGCGPRRCETNGKKMEYVKPDRVLQKVDQKA